MLFRRLLPYLLVLGIGLGIGRFLIGSPPPPETKSIAPMALDSGASSIPVADVQSFSGVLEVHFIDVGQGDSIFIRAADGSSALIDGGNPNGMALTYLRSLGVTHINAVILSHPHADHVGGLVDVLKNLPVDQVWTSGASHTTGIFERFIDTIAERGIPYHEAATGDKISMGSLTLDVLYGVASGGDLNDTSLVLRLQDGDVSFLFTGDAETPTEATLLKTNPGALAATILKVGHHGSSTSSSIPFLQAVHPVVAVYSAGTNNQYGHPHASTLANLTVIGAAIYGTDKYGTITIKTDGKTYQVSTTRGTEIVQLAATALPSPVGVETPMAAATQTSWQLAGLPYDPMGRDRNCSAFATHEQAQAFFIAAGGPEHDRHRLDGDHDGIACESLP